MIRKVLSYLQLNKVGVFELLVAIYPILSGYSYGFLHGNVFFIFLLAIFSFFKPRKNINTLWLNLLIAFVFLHELLLMFIINAPSYFINNTLNILIISLSIIPISRALNYEKFVGSLNWVSIIAILGLVYQFTVILSGGTVTPIKLPFMPDMNVTSRLYEEGVRPSSFFWEPAAFVSFLMVPLFISLYKRKFLWTGVLVLAMFLSTSSTGILMSFIMLIAYVFSQKINFKTRAFVLVFGGILTFALLNSSYFEAGINKIQNTDIEENARLMNGYFLYNSLDDTEKVFGIEAANVDDYHRKHGGKFFVHANDTIFVPTFWLTLAKYGIIGLVLLLCVFCNFVKKDKRLIPYVLVVLLGMFFQGLSIGSSGFAYQLIFLYSFIGSNTIKQ